MRIPDRSRRWQMEDRDAENIKRNALPFIAEGLAGVLVMITAAQLRAARALAGMDQKTLAEKAGVSLPTIQRMVASTGNVRGVVETLTKIIEALDAAGIELIGENAPS